MSEQTPSAHSMTVETPETERENLAAKLSVLERENAKLKKDNDKTNAAIEGARRFVESTVALLGIYSECEERTYDDCIEPVRKAIEALKASKDDARKYAYGADRFGGEVLRALGVDDDLKGRSYDECIEPVRTAIEALKVPTPWRLRAIQDDLAEERATVARLSHQVAELRSENTSLLQTTRDLQAAVDAAVKERDAVINPVIQELREEINRLSNLGARCDEDRDNLRAILTDTEKRLSECLTQRAQMQEEIDALQSDEDNETQDTPERELLNSLRYDRDRANLRIQSLEVDLDLMNIRFSRLQQMAIGMVKSI